MFLGFLRFLYLSRGSSCPQVLCDFCTYHEAVHDVPRRSAIIVVFFHEAVHVLVPRSDIVVLITRK